MIDIFMSRSDPFITGAAARNRDKLRAWLQGAGLDGVIISRRDNFAWVTCGGDNRVINCSEVGVGHIVITQNKHYLVSYYMDSDRIIEEQVPGQEYEQVTMYWHEGDERLRARDLAGQRVGADTHVPGTAFVGEEVMDLQWPLNDLEVERSRWLGRQVGQILENVLREVEPGMTEREIQHLLHSEIIRCDKDYEVAIVGSDERIHKHRHVLATDKPLERYLLLGPVVRRWGLFALVSRSVHFGEPPTDVRKAFHCVATIEGRIMAMLREGLPFAAILAQHKQWYDELGFPGGWNYHFQGGPTGYTLVDAARSLTHKIVQVPQTFSWFTTARGAKVEELTLLTADGVEIPSIGDNWPTIEVDTVSGPFTVPGMLIR
ncbi:MAG TPA: M24 family metallopeptidase [Aggregatilineaceae bacterium]|nr:M24 family metallopeptidase [Aggregatilineaceae bacterium]